MNGINVTSGEIVTNETRKPFRPYPGADFIRRNEMSLLVEELARDRIRQLVRDAEVDRRIRLIRRRRRLTRGARSATGECDRKPAIPRPASAGGPLTA